MWHLTKLFIGTVFRYVTQARAKLAVVIPIVHLNKIFRSVKA